MRDRYWISDLKKEVGTVGGLFFQWRRQQAVC